jgi:LacI family transcriptional regulator
MARSQVKQVDVAIGANVSRASVSAVMNGTRPVSPQLRRRVLQAMHDLGYEPDAIARGLRLRRTYTIGMLAANIFSPFWPAVVRGAEDRAREHHYSLLFLSTDEEVSRHSLGIRIMLGRRVDGLILAPTAEIDEPLMSQLEASGLPVVLVDRKIEGTKFGSVTVDNENAAYHAVMHLIEGGRKRIACLSIPTTVTTGRDRVAGFRRACADAGLSSDAALIRYVSLTVADGFSQASELLRARPRPDAIFATNHSATIAALEAFRAFGVVVPDEVALVGFDDQPWLALMHPPVTAVSQPTYEFGRQAVEQVMRLIDDAESGPVDTVMATSFVDRETCGCRRPIGANLAKRSPTAEPALEETH